MDVRWPDVKVTSAEICVKSMQLFVYLDISCHTVKKEISYERQFEKIL